jgi:Tfp pilus assembly protein PilO
MNDAQQIAEIQRLGREVAKLSARVAMLEQQGTVVDQIKRLVDALNQFGVLQSVLIQNQTTVKQPASPWRPV